MSNYHITCTDNLVKELAKTEEDIRYAIGREKSEIIKQELRCKLEQVRAANKAYFDFYDIEFEKIRKASKDLLTA